MVEKWKSGAKAGNWSLRSLFDIWNGVSDAG